MAITRRTLVRGLGMGVLGAGALSGCGDGEGIRGRRGRRRATTTAPTAGALEEPETPLVIGQIGASYGRAAPFEKSVAVAISEAAIDVNDRWDGLFGQEVALHDRHVMSEAGEDLSDVIAGFADEGVTCVITSIDEEALVAAMPHLVEHEMAVIDVFTSGMQLRSAEVHTANLLARLSPNDRTIAALYEEAAWSSSDRGGPAGTVAFVSQDTMQGRGLLHQITQLLNPKDGRVLSEQFYPVGDIGNVGERVSAVLETPPALLVVNGGPEAGPFLSALREATLDEDGRPAVEFPIRLGPAATLDYSQIAAGDSLVAESLAGATGYEPGGEITVEHENMMLNRDAGFLTSGYAYSQQAYDAFTLACLAAQDALAVDGPAIASSLPRVLTGSEECTDYGLCRGALQTALEAQETTTIAYVGRTGAVELGPQADLRTGELREYSWSEANVLEAGTAKNVEDPV
ncbi:ABC transporter substrate-binding protein [Brachybacterium sp. YJGR34]|uniref:ABC transporter substrate-binding protein n=1 Tax=Brachybacterium sp. YJGR34 TaxID=2059911 RepID=UPI000E0B43B0|nr:ABC transporter substrate-binding protein [Brachybacterium sp. YJGR34]